MIRFNHFSRSASSTGFCFAMALLGALCASQAFALQIQFRGLPELPSSQATVPPSSAAPIPTAGNSRFSTSPQQPQDGKSSVQQTAWAAPSHAAIYELQLSRWREFEAKLQSNWLGNENPQTTEDGKVARYAVPTNSGKFDMLIDRQSGQIAMYGSPTMAGDWMKCMQLIDQYDAQVRGGQVRIVKLGNLKPELVSTAFKMMEGAKARPVSPLAPRRQDETLPTGRRQIEDVVPLGQQNNALMQLTAQEGITLIGNVTVEVVPNMNMLIVKGDNQEDVDRVKEYINTLVKAAELNEPKLERVPLQNGEPSAMATAVKQVYDEVYLANQGTVSVMPVQDPKALLIVGSQESLTTLKGIIAEYDRAPGEVPQVPNFKTFRLKHVSANDAKQRIDEFFGQASQQNLITPPDPAPIVTISDYRSNTLMVKASQSYLLQVEQLIEAIDVVDTEAKRELRTFFLKNTLASNVATVLQQSINGGMANAPQGYNPSPQLNTLNNQGGLGGGLGGGGTTGSPGLSQYGSSGLSLVTVGADGKKHESGILFDVRISADATSNQLVVTAPTESMDLIAALVEQLDTIPQTETQIKVFQIINGDAESLFTMLQTLFAAQTGQQQQGGFGGFGGTTGAQLGTLPLETSSFTSGATLANLKFSVDLRTNTIIVSGPVGDLQVIESLLIRLDEEETIGRKLFVYRVANLSALDLSDAVNGWLDTRRSAVTETDPTSNNQYTISRREVIVQPEVVSNSLIVNARPEYLDEVMQVIVALDRRPPMVKIKVLIAEVNLSMVEEFGADIGLQDSLLFDRGIGTIGFPFNQAAIGNNTTSATSLASRDALGAQALSNLGTGRTNSTLGYGGLVLSAGNDSVNLLLRALQDKQCARILSAPDIMSMENQLGRIQVGSTVRFISDSTITGNGLVQNSVEAVDIGVILEVTPRVSPDGMIVMAVNAINSTLGPEAQGTAVSTSANGAIIRIPQILATTAQTTIMARHGQTVVFSGLIREEKTQFERGAPFLKDIPLLGNLFKFQGETAIRKELMIILTPYLVESEDDVVTLNYEAMDRMHWCLNDVAEVYGSTNYDQSRESYSSPSVYYPDNDPTGIQPASMNEQPFKDKFFSDDSFNGSQPPSTTGPARQNQSRSTGAQATAPDQASIEPSWQPASTSRVQTTPSGATNAAMPKVTYGENGSSIDRSSFRNNPYVKNPDSNTAPGKTP